MRKIQSLREASHVIALRLLQLALRGFARWRKMVRYRKCGRPKKVIDELRANVISVRLSRAEQSAIRTLAKHVGITPSALMRATALGATPRAVVPEINRVAYAELGRLAGNLNQVLKLAHSGVLSKMDNDLLPGLLEQIICLRLELLGVTSNGG